MPECLLVENRTSLTPEQQVKVDMAMAEKSDTWWAGQINASWQKSVDSIIETGSLLLKAKLALGHGFTAMIKTKLLFGERTTEMLMRIADHPVLSNPNHGSVLPPSWRTLYELTKIPNKTLIAKIEDGTIKADFERKDVAALKGGKPVNRRNNTPATSNSEPAPAPATTFTVLDHWKEADREERATFINTVSLIEFFAVMSPERRTEIEKRVLGQAKHKSKLIESTLAT
jgi:hypothetical protein